MNPAEDLTARWLISKGYFVMPRIKIGAHELDLLAVKLTDDKSAVFERVHVEVCVPSNPAGGNWSDDVCREGATEEVRKKFSAVENEVHRLIGGGYSRWYIRGAFPGGDRVKELWTSTMSDLGVTLVPFELVIREYAEAMKYRPQDYVGQLIHILKSSGTLTTA